MSNYVFLLVILPLFFSIFFLARLLTTFFHELGHAIPALIFTKEKVDLYLGSYGDDTSRRIALGKRFTIFFYLNPLKLNHGMVRHSGCQLITLKRFLITLSGPLISFLLAISALWVVFSFNLNGFLKLFSIGFLLSAVFDLRNLYPSNNLIKLHDGTYAYCDGYNLARLIRYREQNELLNKGTDLYNKSDFRGAFEVLEGIRERFTDDYVFSIMISSYLQCYEYEKARAYLNGHLNNFILSRLSADSLCDVGMVESFSDNDEQALYYYNSALKIDNDHIIARCNRGYTYNLLQRFREAEKDFTKVLSIDPNYAYAYSNRAYTKLKTGRLAHAMEDIQQSLTLDENNSYAHRNLGIYYLETGDHHKAVTQFKKALKLNPATHLTNEYLKDAESKLGIIP
jgi:tetratricopeptide (TPR) repeat protein